PRRPPDPGAGQGRTRRVPGPQVTAPGGGGRGGHRAHRGEEPNRVGAPHPRGAPAGRQRRARRRPAARRGGQELAARGALVPRRAPVPERRGDRLTAEVGGGWWRWSAVERPVEHGSGYGFLTGSP